MRNTWDKAYLFNGNSLCVFFLEIFSDFSWYILYLRTPQISKSSDLRAGSYWEWAFGSRVCESWKKSVQFLHRKSKIMFLWPDEMITDMLSMGVQLYWCSALDRGYVARLTWIIFQLEQHIWYITMKLLRRLWNPNKRWQSSLLMSSSSFASPGHHDDEIMRGGEAMKEWDLDQHFLKKRMMNFLKRWSNKREILLQTRPGGA